MLNLTPSNRAHVVAKDLGGPEAVYPATLADDAAEELPRQLVANSGRRPFFAVCRWTVAAGPPSFRVVVAVASFVAVGSCHGSLSEASSVEEPSGCEQLSSIFLRRMSLGRRFGAAFVKNRCRCRQFCRRGFLSLLFELLV